MRHCLPTSFSNFPLVARVFFRHVKVLLKVLNQRKEKNEWKNKMMKTKSLSIMVCFTYVLILEKLIFWFDVCLFVLFLFCFFFHFLCLYYYISLILLFCYILIVFPLKTHRTYSFSRSSRSQVFYRMNSIFSNLYFA